MYAKNGKKNFAMNFFLALAAAILGPAEARAQSPSSDESFPTWSEVRATVDSHFAKLPDLQPGDLITASDAAPALKALEELGWKDVSRCETVSRILEDGSFLARELRSDPGRIFMRRVSGYKLIYDRLDRVSQMPGGQKLIHDMIRLPDGHRYAQMQPHQGTPPMTDFLPKGASGKAPRVRDLDKPTGRIYTQSELLAQLETEYRRVK
jgi:hypothetical protein